MSDAAVGSVVDCTVLSSTFPGPIAPEISRDAILNLIDDFFASNIQLVTLEGKPDVGKTRILAQFAKRHPSHTISVFIKPNSWFMQDSQLLYADVAAQMHWALTKSELPDPHTADDGLIRRLSFDLQRQAKHTGQVFYFLVDGTEDLLDGPGHFANTLLAVLPVEFSAFRFLFSGEAKWLPTLALSQAHRKSYAIARRAHAEEARRLVRELFDATMSASEITAALINRATGKAANLIPRGISNEDRTIIEGGQRDRAVEYLREWLRANARDFLKICDPYFGPRELEVLQLVLSTAPNLQVTIVTSRKQQEQEKVEFPWDDYYLNYWRRNFSEQQPPKTEFVVVGGRSGELPIHDRWWLTEGKGLRFGSSFSGLGKSRDSEISELSPSEIAERLMLTEAYTTRQKREHLGERLTYHFVYL